MNDNINKQKHCTANAIKINDLKLNENKKRLKDEVIYKKWANAKYYAKINEMDFTLFNKFKDFEKEMRPSFDELSKKITEKNVSLSIKNKELPYSFENCFWRHSNDRYSAPRRGKSIEIIYPNGEKKIINGICDYVKQNKLSLYKINLCLNGEISDYNGVIYKRVNKGIRR